MPDEQHVPEINIAQCLMNFIKVKSEHLYVLIKSLSNKSLTTLYNDTITVNHNQGIGLIRNARRYSVTCLCM